MEIAEGAEREAVDLEVLPHLEGPMEDLQHPRQDFRRFRPAQNALLKSAPVADKTVSMKRSVTSNAGLLMNSNVQL